MTNKTYTEEPIMLSALEHYSYCPRQCALIHLESVWEENVYTMRGRDVHERVDEASSQESAGVREERALPIWSTRLNLTGRADVVEFHDGVPYPVEYKSGRRRKGRPEAIQLCAQAMCLEEMLGMRIEKGALYWHGSRERKEVVFTAELRRQVEDTVAGIRAMMADHRLPPPVNDKRCDECSLREACMPDVVDDKVRCRKAVRSLFDVSPDKERRAT